MTPSCKTPLTSLTQHLPPPTLMLPKRGRMPQTLRGRRMLQILRRRRRFPGPLLSPGRHSTTSCRGGQWCRVRRRRKSSALKPLMPISVRRCWFFKAYKETTHCRRISCWLGFSPWKRLGSTRPNILLHFKTLQLWIKMLRLLRRLLPRKEAKTFSVKIFSALKKRLPKRKILAVSSTNWI